MWPPLYKVDVKSDRPLKALWAIRIVMTTIPKNRLEAKGDCIMDTVIERFVDLHFNIIIILLTGKLTIEE